MNKNILNPKKCCKLVLNSIEKVLTYVKIIVDFFNRGE